MQMLIQRKRQNYVSVFYNSIETMIHRVHSQRRLASNDHSEATPFVNVTKGLFPTHHLYSHDLAYPLPCTAASGPLSSQTRIWTLSFSLVCEFSLCFSSSTSVS